MTDRCQKAAFDNTPLDNRAATRNGQTGSIFTKCNLIRLIRGFQPITARITFQINWWSLSSHAHLTTSHLYEAAAAIWEGLLPCGRFAWNWIGACPVSTNFTHWAALKFCTALQNFSKFLVSGSFAFVIYDENTSQLMPFCLITTSIITEIRSVKNFDWLLHSP